MAHITKSANGKWRSAICTKGVRDSKTFDSKEAALLWGMSRENEVRRLANIPEMTDKLAAAQTLLCTGIPGRVLSAIAEVPHSGIDIIESSIPVENHAGVYFLIKNKEVVYVGQTIDIFSRISKHRRLGKEFDSFSFINCDDQAQRDKLETTYILALAPWMNLSMGRQRLKFA